MSKETHSGKGGRKRRKEWIDRQIDTRIALELDERKNKVGNGGRD